MIRAIIIGSNPSTASKTPKAFDLSTSSGRRLNDWVARAGTDEGIFLNVAQYTTPKNRSLKVSEIQEALPALEQNIAHYISLFPDAKIIAVGTTAAKALTLLHREYYQMPHPSGCNRQLNDEDYVEEKVNGLAEYLLARSDSSLSKN